ncbi:hypothetical protein BJX70DRAFT_398785 [Aspergillus crustosus]
MPNRAKSKRPLSEAQTSDRASKREKVDHDLSTRTHTKKSAKPADSGSKKSTGSCIDPEELVSSFWEKEEQQYDESRNWVWDKTKPLEEQIQLLGERAAIFDSFLKRCTGWRCFLDGKWAMRSMHGDYLAHFPKRISEIEGAIMSWTNEFIVDDIAHLTAEQKKEIVASLDGYLVQDNLDSIQGRLHPNWKGNLPQTLAEIFLHKFVIKTMFGNPFWNVNENARPGDTESLAWDVNDEHAHIWRALTIRLCNTTGSWIPKTADYQNFAEATKAHRDAMCNAMASHLLADKAFSCLVKKDAQQDKVCAEDLAYWLQYVAEIAMGMHKHVSVLEVKNLKDLDRGYREPSDTMTREDDPGEYPPKGFEVLGITGAYITRRLNNNDEDEIELVSKAKALLGRAEPPTAHQEE